MKSFFVRLSLIYLFFLNNYQNRGKKREREKTKSYNIRHAFQQSKLHFHR
jgi:hypothetical protein